MGDQAEPTRRSSRQRSGLSIFDEALLFELHNEMMEQEPPKQRVKAKHLPPKPSKMGSLATAATTTAAAAATDVPHSSRDIDIDHRETKRQRSEHHYSSGGASRGTSSIFTNLRDAESYFNLDMGTHTAWACGLAIDGLSEDEKGILPPEGNASDYSRVRNHILCLWRRNVARNLSVKEAVEAVKPRDQPYALAAWRFLDANGYINFGVNSDSQHQVDTGAEGRGSVIVIGAGCAGLAAARQLRAKGYKVLILEGRSRPGGRVFTDKLSTPDGKASVVAEVGGSIITGIDGNPLAIIARQMQIPFSHIRDRAPIYMPDGSPADDALDTAVEHHYNQLLMKGCHKIRETPEQVENLSLLGALERMWAEKYPELEKSIQNSTDTHQNKADNAQKPGETSRSRGLKTQDETSKTVRQLFEWHLANLEFANACRLETCSLLHWDQDDPHELPGAHCFVPGCNGRWLKSLCQGLAIHYNSPVTEICYCKSGVAVHTPNKIFKADAVVVTTPLGVLQRGMVRFNPPLPDQKQRAIARLGFGNLNKVIMMFPHVFWSEKEDMFGHISEDPFNRGEAFLFYSYAQISGGAQLTALIAGEAAEEQEKRPVSESATRVLAILRKIFEPQGIQVPAPIEVLVTRWGSDPFAYGAYSSLPVGSKGGEDYDTLAESIGGRVFFAGEATTRRHPATMHGAFFTGLWTAANVDAALSKAKGVPEVGSAATVEVIKEIAEAAAAKEEAAAAALQTLRADHAAAARFLEEKDDERAEFTPQQAVAFDRDLQDKFVLSSRLKMLFDDPLQPPDLEVGSCKFVFGPSGSPYAEQALLKLNVSTGNSAVSLLFQTHQNPPVLVYCMVRKEVALALAEQPDNNARMAILSSLPEVKIQERRGLGRDAQKLVEAVLRSRREGFKPSTNGNINGRVGAAAVANDSSHYTTTKTEKPAPTAAEDKRLQLMLGLAAAMDDDDDDDGRIVHNSHTSAAAPNGPPPSATTTTTITTTTTVRPPPVLPTTMAARPPLPPMMNFPCTQPPPGFVYAPPRPGQPFIVPRPPQFLPGQRPTPAVQGGNNDKAVNATYAAAMAYLQQVQQQQQQPKQQ